jgi:hypothetical protein
VKGHTYNFNLYVLLSTKFSHKAKERTRARTFCIKNADFRILCWVSRRHERIIAFRKAPVANSRIDANATFRARVGLWLGWCEMFADLTIKGRSHSTGVGAGGPSSHIITLTHEEGLTPRRFHEVRPKAARKKAISRAWLGNSGFRIKEGMW